jgi:hypothetical protein
VPTHAPEHPLAGEARREAVPPEHLAVTAGAAPLPLLLLRAELRPEAEAVANQITLRIGLLADARALPGRCHALRGTLLLRVAADAPAIRQAEVAGLAWRSGKGDGWSRIPTAADRPAHARYEGRAAVIARDLSAWALTPAAEPAIAAALRAGAALLQRAAADFESDAARHALDADRPAASEASRQRDLAWAARQRGMAAQQRRNAAWLDELAATLRAAPDAAAMAGPLALAAAEAARHAAGRAQAARQADDAASRALAQRQERARARAAAARLAATAPALADALERLMTAVATLAVPEPGPERDALAQALAAARDALAAARA